MWGEKFKLFLRFVIFWSNQQNLGPKTGGCLSRCNRNLKFWPKTGGVFGIKGTVFREVETIKNIYPNGAN